MGIKSKLKPYIVPIIIVFGIMLCVYLLVGFISCVHDVINMNIPTTFENVAYIVTLFVVAFVVAFCYNGGFKKEK